MPQRALAFVLPAIIVLASAACTTHSRAPRTNVSRSCDAPGVDNVVTRFGASLKRVSVLAPRPTLEHTIRKVYAPFVTARLLQAWLQTPADAPGKRVSSPWPARIEIDSIRPAGEHACRVAGKIIYLTSAELANGGVAATKPVVLYVRKNGHWRIDAYTEGEWQ